MFESLREAAEALSREAGWLSPVFDEDGCCRYALEDGLELTLLSPDGRALLLRADLGEAPDLQGPDAYAATERWRTVGMLAAASMRARRSTLGAADGRLELYRLLSLDRCTSESLAQEAGDFLNDEAWWRERLSGEAPGASGASPFSAFSMPSSSWFTGNPY